MDVEGLAVAEIQRMVGRCHHVKPILATNDKTPFTDGHIDVYGGVGQSKKEWLGRVGVQVKGRTYVGKPKRAPTFGISRIDLLAFQTDSGVLYFFVTVDRNGECTPYYALLAPFTIEHYLRQAPAKQKKIAVSFKELPSDTGEIEKIVGLALKTREQRSSIGLDPAVFERMRSIKVHSTADLDLTSPVLLTPGAMDFALEIVTEGGMTVPLSGALHIVPQDYIEHESGVVIGSASVTYDQVRARRINATSVQFTLDEGLSLVFVFTPSQQQLTINFDAPSNFAKRLAATEFLGEIASSGELIVNGMDTSVGNVSRSDWVKDLNAQLAFLRQLAELFEHLAVNSELVEFDDLDDRQILNLQNLHRAFVKGEEPSNKEGEPTRGLMDVGPWMLMILIVPGDEPNTWRYVNPFDPAAPHLFRWSAEADDSSDTVPVTAYDIVEQEEFSKLLNLQLDAIVPAYEAILDSPQTTNLANQRVLTLLLAADASKVREDEFLRAAETLNEWLISYEGEKAAHLINRWQILWRRGALTAEDRAAILSMKRRMVQNDGVMAAEAELSCALLAGNADEVDYLIDQLADDKLQTMQGWPIWRLHGSDLAPH